MNWRDIRVGIVGLGGIGRVHADRLVERDISLIGGVDADVRTNGRFADTYGVESYEQYQELYDDVDAIIVATPNCHHEEYAVAALDAGLSVLLEKPPAHSLDSAERIADAARWSSGFCMVGFNNRYANSVEVIKAFQRAGRFGDVRHIEANYIRRRGVPEIGSWFTDARASGGGSLIDIGVHVLDLAFHILDFPPIAEVTATTRSNFGSRDDYAAIEWGTTAGVANYDVDDSVTAFIRAADGTTVTLEAAWATNRPPDSTVSIRGTDAGVCFDRKNDTVTLYESGTAGTDYLANTDIVTRQNDTYAAEQETFLKAVARDEPPDGNTIEQGIVVQRVIDAIYRSSRVGRAIRLAEPKHEKPKADRIVHQGNEHRPEIDQQESTDDARSPIARFHSPPSVRVNGHNASGNAGRDRQPEHDHKTVADCRRND